MTDEERPATEAELREAELLARALEDREGPGSDPAPLDDALGAAWLLHSARSGDLGELRARAVLARIWPAPSSRSRLRAAGAAAAALAAAAAFVASRARAPASLPAPPISLLRAQLAAARPGAPADLADLDRRMAEYRQTVYEALRRAPGGKR
jgi:hypothetical protein